MSELKDFLNGGGSLAPQVNANTESIKRLPSRNFVTNGAAIVNQIGPNQVTNIVENTTYIDCWSHSFNGPTGINIDKASGDYPSGFYSSFKTTFSTAFTTVGASNFTIIKQAIENVKARDLVGREFTISFWVKASVAGTYSVSLRDVPITTSYIIPYTVSAPNVWEKIELTVVEGLPSSFLTNTLRVDFPLLAGSSYITSTPNQWVAGDKLAVSGMPNLAATANNSFNITGLKVELGSQATDFISDYSLELMDCKRRHQKHRIYSVLKPLASTSYLGYTGILPVEMISNPSVSYSSGGQANRVNVHSLGLVAISSGGFTLTTNTHLIVDAIVNGVGANWWDVDVILSVVVS